MSAPFAAAGQTIKVVATQRGSLEGAVPHLGQEQGIFKKHGLTLDILYTQGSGETIQAVVSGSASIGLSAGTMAVFGAFQKGAPLRIISSNSTGSSEIFWYVPASSPIQSMRDTSGKTISFSTHGASTHIAVLGFIDEYKLAARPIGTGNPAATYTQAMSGQIDVGWSVAPFQLAEIQSGRIRVIGRGSDVPSIRDQTTRVQIANAQFLQDNKDVVERYMRAYRETLDWLYASPEALAKYLEFSGFTEPVVKYTMAEFITKDNLQTERVSGIEAVMQGAVQFKFIARPLTPDELATLIRIPAR
jgi:NitT/TauT family transport system substrate-binding protein